jgi:hypothetical protein
MIIICRLFRPVLDNGLVRQSTDLAASELLHAMVAGQALIVLITDRQPQLLSIMSLSILVTSCSTCAYQVQHGTY